MGGFLWSHLGWFLSGEHEDTEWDRIRDFARYPELRRLDRHYLIPPLALALFLFVVGGVWALVNLPRKRGRFTPETSRASPRSRRMTRRSSGEATRYTNCSHESRGEELMSTTMWILLIVVLVLAFGGGGGYLWSRSRN